MKILVTGANGQLGKAVVKEVNKRGHEVIAAGREILDITDEDAVENIFSQICPDAVIHCAAYVNVEKAEDEKELCGKANVSGTQNLVTCCKKADTKMLYVSTDYVFAGVGNHFQKVEEEKRPLNEYGRSKHEGEEIVRGNLEKYFIVRTSWVFGEGKGNFVDTMLTLAEERNEIKVVNDQTGSPTYAPDLAKLLVDMIETEKYGVYHATNEGVCTWFEFAKEIFRQTEKEVVVEPVTSGEFYTKANRPQNSRLDKSKLTEMGFGKLPHWENALTKYLQEK